MNSHDCGFNITPQKMALILHFLLECGINCDERVKMK